MDDFVLKSIRAQVDAVFAEIKKLEGMEFPYEHSRDALRTINGHFVDRMNLLSALLSENDPNEGALGLLCNEIHAGVRNSLEVLGFILRSTNVRNAFEIHGPLLRLAQAILNVDTMNRMPADWNVSCVAPEKDGLLISSEWMYSPFIVSYRDLSDFVLIGLPATESSNPLLIPLAGHELGHIVWEDFDCKKHIGPLVSTQIVGAVRQHWAGYPQLFDGYNHSLSDDGVILNLPACGHAWDWAMMQSEELFSDFIGLRIFGEAYLHAFAYLVAPWREGQRSHAYPGHVSRANALLDAAKQYGLSVSDSFVEKFKDLKEPDHPYTKQLMSLTDEARQEVHGKLCEIADLIMTAAQITKRSENDVKKCKRVFRFMAPAQHTGGLSNILNAAWDAMLAEKYFHDSAYDKEEKRASYLKEIVLKSIEVYQFEIELEEARLSKAKVAHDS